MVNEHFLTNIHCLSPCTYSRDYIGGGSGGWGGGGGKAELETRDEMVPVTVSDLIVPSVVDPPDAEDP